MTRLICPACGAMSSAEIMSKELLVRETLAIIVRLPQPLPEVALAYLGLFRPAKSALSWEKAKRVAEEFAALVGSGYVQAKGQVARPCPPQIWRQAIEDMLDNRERLRRPMKNHSYLCEVAWPLADRIDALGEKDRNQLALGGNLPRPRGVNPLAKLMGYEDE